MKSEKPNSCEKDISYVADLLKIVAEENRLKILCLLKRGEKCVCDIWQDLNIPQNLTSHHLKVLKDTGLINSRKVGLKMIYSINQTEMTKLRTLIDNFLQNGKRQC